ncbi:uncharacterized protein LOC135839395 [Planococcus citri]|uniref:uncharacterized protein LOC135839395 n=1 Tax=Planococcus citri TaxID=170843 RepID=UPI0031F79B52
MIDFDWDLFSRKVPTLQDLIIDQIAQRLWHDEMILKRKSATCSYRSNGKDSETSTDITFDSTNPLFRILKIGQKITSNETKPANSICIPPNIEYMIRQRILKIETEIKNWLQYHREEVFKGPIYHNHQINILNRLDFNELTYDNNCRINYKKTARNMLDCKKFSVIDKFMIASAYCFGHDIAQMWPAVSKVLHRYEFSFDLYPLPYYWRCQMTNRLNDMPVAVQGNIRRICPRVGGNVLAWEYFYEILLGAKIDLDSIDRVFRCAYPQSIEATVKKCFPALSEDDLKYVFSNYGSNIMIRLMTTPSLRKFVLPIWLRVNHIIDGDTLLRIFQEILLKQDSEKIIQFLSREIWHHTSSELRSYVLNYFQRSNSFNEFRTLMYEE